jgi:hypothetical protein
MTTQTIREEISQALKANELYNRFIKRWQFYYESYMGGDDYKKALHLRKYQLETEEEYSARLLTTPLENHVASVVGIYTSFLFRIPPTREYGSIANLVETEQFLADADLEGRHLDAFMREAAAWASVFGHVWVLLTKPNVGAETQAEEQMLEVRPYASILTPLVVTDWVWKRKPNGRYELAYLKYLEDVNGDVKTIKEWTPETITTKVINDKDYVIYETTVEENQLGLIPVVPVYNSRSLVRGIGNSAIGDIADMQKFIYNSTSEVATSIALDSHPSLVTTLDTNIGTGAGSVIRVPENMDPALKPYLLDFAGANINNIYSSIQHTTEAIEKMANVGGIRATESRTLSGIAMELEFQLLNARLSEMADNLELAEEQIWRLFCMYQNQPYDMTIDYPGSFAIRDTGRELEELRKAKEITTDPVIMAEINSRIADILEIEDYEPQQDIVVEATEVESEPAEDTDIQPD